VIDPWLSLAALSLALAGAPVLPDADPGPSEVCPKDMRIVEGTHHDEVSHLCRDARDMGKRSLCYGYDEGFTVLEGPTTQVRVCMDQYEAPNKRGSNPMVMQSYDMAVKWCGKRGKRICSEQEWELACEGSDSRPWAYGWRVNTKLCNSGKGWKAVDFSAFGKTKDEAKAESDRLWQGTRSGRYKTCVSSFGVYDMMGNAEEWVASRKSRKYAGSLMGGFWAKPWTGCRGTNDAHRAHFAFYETGFRCCSEPAVPNESASKEPGSDK
jgi:sulfatase modifying factor 1